MLSFKKHHDAPPSESAVEMVRVLAPLVEGIAATSISLHEVDNIAFQDEIRNLGKALTPDITEAHALALVESVQKAADVYNRGIEKSVQALTQQVHTMTGGFTHALLDVSQESETASANLLMIEHQIQEIEPAVLHEQVAAALQALQREMARKHAADAGLIEKLKEGVSSPLVCQISAKASAQEDPVTGLGGQAHAAMRLERIYEGAKEYYYAVIYVVEGLMSVNTRLGFAAGDQMLRQFSQQITEYMTASDGFFRWRGPAFLSVLKRTADASLVEQEAARITNRRHSQTMDVGEHAAAMHIAASVTILPLASFESAGALFMEIDSIVAGKSAA